MGKIYQSVTELIGKTPLLKANNFIAANDLPANVLVKLEYFNPAGSVKDRIAKAMIEQAEKEGKLKPGSVIIEPTSGNTGIGLASVAAARGYKAILTMPETMSVERRNLLKAYGAKIVLTDGSKGMKGAIAKAEELAKETPGSFIPSQFTNQANPAAHEATTGPEIWEDADGKVDAFIAGVGTGGTLTGVARYLKKQNPDVHVVAVEPATSPVLSKGQAGPHKIQGIGAGFVPETLDTKIYDEVIAVPNDDAFKYGRQFSHAEGILIGISSPPLSSSPAATNIKERTSSPCCPTPATATSRRNCSQSNLSPKAPSQREPSVAQGTFERNLDTSSTFDYTVIKQESLFVTRNRGKRGNDHVFGNGGHRPPARQGVQGDAAAARDL